MIHINMIHKITFPIFLAIFLSLVVLPGHILKAQLFPGLEGESLADAIRNAYTPSQLLNFTQVKDTLYAKVFIESDSVKCIYSGLSHYIPEGVDPSQWVFGSGNETESINLEHGWPQSKGAGDGTQGQMNMYNLFPSRVAINSDRGDFPYADIDDNTTTKWYYLGIEQSSKPAENMNAYSEFRAGYFEPRESVKGDIARAMFYFWTIYRDDAITADPNYFEQQRVAMCQWQEDDIADDFENLRNDRIAIYQGGQKNPFVIDCSLAKRTYCPLQNDCNSVPVIETHKISFELRFDPTEQRLMIASEDDEICSIYIAAISGDLIFSETLPVNEWSKTLDLSPGIYVGYCVGKSGISILKFFVS